MIAGLDGVVLGGAIAEVGRAGETRASVPDVPRKR
jgi:hypothetical protein